jgi:threonine aldolase
MPPPVDLRSDTVTKPSNAMRHAMASAEVGDDWYGDDPTVNRLQDRAAEVTGKDAALYVPTGTMANQIALHLWVRSGNAAACEEAAHFVETELASAAALSGVGFRTLHTGSPRRQLTADIVREGLGPDPINVQKLELLCVENTHMAGGGSVMPVAELHDIRAVAVEAGVPVHLDGARIFNAVAAAGCDVADYASQADSMMFCLSKGLGAPIGSMLLGSQELIAEAWRTRVLFGGAWRQAGIMAAAGLIALEEGPKRLHEDHARAKRLATGVAEILPKGLPEPETVETNMIYVDVEAAGMPLMATIDRLAGAGLKTVPVMGNIRMVTHVDISDEDIDHAVTAWRSVVEGD